MCLAVDQELTTQKKRSKTKVFTFYKVLRYGRETSMGRSEVGFYTPYRDVRIESYGVIDKPYSDGTKVVSHSDSFIHGGAFHLYYSADKAEFECSFGSDRLLIKVKTNKEDIIAFGDDRDVAVKQYTIPKEEWDKAIKEAKQNYKNWPRSECEDDNIAY